MARYVKFETVDGNNVLVQIEDGSELVPKGPVRAGISKIAEDVIIDATQKFEDVWDVAYHNVRAFWNQIERFAGDSFEKPDEVELTFGLKATGEGTMAIAKAGIEASYDVKLVWKKEKVSPTKLA